MAVRRVLVPIIAAIVIISSISVVAVTVVNNSGSGSQSFTIIHTNDTHCYYNGDGLDPVGFTTVSTLRENYSEKGPVFTVDAGDFLQGNPYGTLTQGEGSVEVMNTVGYDFGIPGNHEFDFGLDILKERAGQLDYPLICANLVYEDTGESLFKEYLILEKGGVKVGFFGLLTTETHQSTMPGKMGNLQVTDPVEAAKRMVSLLQKENVCKIVAVGHLGVTKEGFATSDQVCHQVPGIDIFIDGHSHTEMEDGKVCDGSIILEESNTVIASTGCYLHNAGVITSDSSGIKAKLYRGPALQNKTTADAISDVIDEVDKKLNVKIGSTEILLDGIREHVRNGETNLGDFATDAMRIGTDSDIAIINAGAIRHSIEVGDITMRSVYEVMPFLNFTCTVEAPGSALWEEMEYSIKLIGISKGGYLQFSGMTVTYDPNGPEGSKVTSIKVGGVEVDKTATYKIVATDFIVAGGDGNVFLKDYEAVPNESLDYIFTEYIKSVGTVTDSTIEGNRMIALDSL